MEETCLPNVKGIVYKAKLLRVPSKYLVLVVFIRSVAIVRHFHVYTTPKPTLWLDTLSTMF